MTDRVCSLETAAITSSAVGGEGVLHRAGDAGHSRTSAGWRLVPGARREASSVVLRPPGRNTSEEKASRTVL